MKTKNLLIRAVVFCMIPVVQRGCHATLGILEGVTRKLDALGFSLAKRLPKEDWEKMERGQPPFPSRPYPRDNQ